MFRHALDYALAIARWSGGSVTALQVVTPVPYTDPIMAPALVFTPEDIGPAAVLGFGSTTRRSCARQSALC